MRCAFLVSMNADGDRLSPVTYDYDRNAHASSSSVTTFQPADTCAGDYCTDILHGPSASNTCKMRVSNPDEAEQIVGCLIALMDI